MLLNDILGALLAMTVSGPVLQGLLKALLERRALRKRLALTRRDLVGMLFIGLGVTSLLMSYFGWFWVSGSRVDWWQSFHTEVGAALLLIGAVETLLMTRLENGLQGNRDSRTGRTKDSL